MASPFGITPAEMNSSDAGPQNAAPAPIPVAPIQPTQPEAPIATAPAAQPIVSPFGITPKDFNNTPETPIATAPVAPKNPSDAPIPIPVFGDAVEAAKAAGNKFIEGYKQTEQSMQNGTVGDKLSLLGRGILNEAAGGIEFGFSPITGALAAASKLPVISQTIDLIKKWVVDPASNAISEAPALQNFMKTYPHADEVLGNAITVVGALAGGKKAPEIKAATTDATGAIADTYSALKEKVTSDTAAPAPEPAAGVFTPEMKAQVQKVADEWRKPTTENSSVFNNARAVIEKDPTVPEFLAEQRIDPFSHIEDGKYSKDAMEASAERLRDTAGAVTRDALRPALHAADYGQEPMAVEKLKVTPDMADHLITPGDEKSVQANIDSEMAALKEKYPNGMTLVQQLDNKIVYDKNGGWKEYKPAADNNKALANRAIANALRDSLDKNVPEGIPVKEVNAYSSKFYKSADYLEALGGKKAPVSLPQQAVRYASRLFGAKVGGMVGGDIVSGFVGYHVGRVLEQALENMTNPMRDAFLRGMKINNPEAYAKLEQYLGKVKADAATSVKLPAPDIAPVKTAVGTPFETNIPAPKGSQSEIRVQPTFPNESSAQTAKGYTVNPKTGDVYERDLKTGTMRIIPKKKK